MSILSKKYLNWQFSTKQKSFEGLFFGLNTEHKKMTRKCSAVPYPF